MLACIFLKTSLYIMSIGKIFSLFCGRPLSALTGIVICDLMIVRWKNFVKKACELILLCVIIHHVIDERFVLWIIYHHNVFT